MKTVMVTGVGAIMGYGLLRSLKSAFRKKISLVGTDIFPDAVGQAWCDAFEKAPLTANSDYLDWLDKIVSKYHIDLIIPGIEQDVHLLSDRRDQLSNFGCKFALNNALLVNLSRDKWAMHQALLELADESRIPSYLSGSYSTLVEKMGLPFLLKPRKSYASKGLVKINGEDDFNVQKSQLGLNLMAQPIVGSEDEEYTVGVFGDGHGNVCASICMRRYLSKEGATAKAWITRQKKLDEVVMRLCNHFKPVGPTNFQFRRDRDSWKLLEINPRISSTSSIRTAFGYNEALMCIEYYLNGELPLQPKIKDGFCVRYIEDHIVYDRDHF